MGLMHERRIDEVAQPENPFEMFEGYIGFYGWRPVIVKRSAAILSALCISAPHGGPGTAPRSEFQYMRSDATKLGRPRGPRFECSAQELAGTEIPTSYGSSMPLSASVNIHDFHVLALQAKVQRRTSLYRYGIGNPLGKRVCTIIIIMT